MGGGEPGGVSQTSRRQRLGALPRRFTGQAVVHVRRGMKASPAVRPAES
jgi:hypothetical protein